MTSPRSYDGVGYYPPSFSSGTPIYDSLVAERGVPQIAPINVPAALPPAAPLPTAGYGSAFESTSLLPALPPARLALGPGTGSSYPPPSYGAPQQPVPGYGGQPYLPGQRMPAPQGQPGYPQAPQPWDQQSGNFRPAPPAPVAPVRPVPPQQFFQQPGQQFPQQQQQQYGQAQQGYGQAQFGQQGQQSQPYQGQAY